MVNIRILQFNKTQNVLTKIILLRIRLGPPAHKPGSRRNTRLEVILDGPEGKIATDIGG